ncbi:MAG: ThuA domain-containing protein [Novosphingobium sp.]|nr:ThuA domain-containing protein [Novosphingobium sp.]
MKPIVRKTLKGLLATVVLMLIVMAALAAWRWQTVQRIFLGGVRVYESVPPAIPAELGKPAILVFSKTNGFRHEEAIPAANALFATFATDNGWGHFQTENGATFSPEILSRFDAVVFNNVSGDVFTPDQRAALKGFVENGGGFVAIHGSGGDFSYDWKWYVDDLIGAQFIGHTMDPQFPKATIHIADKSHPATALLPDTWDREEEWYSFEKSPRTRGYTILATVDETTYKTKGLFGQELAMGKDHPIMWWHCQGKGRALYSALGHRASAYREPEYRAALLGATKWALRLDGQGCAGNADAATVPDTKP